MFIERILSPTGGTVVTLKGTRYHFKPVEDGGPHIAEVTNPEHIARFLEITEGYRAHGEAEDGDAPADPDQDADTLSGGADGADSPPGGQDPDPEPPVPEIPLAEQTDEQLRATFEAVIGRKPHGKASRETLVAQIEAARNGE
jgi:hypothetical protein